MRGGKLLAFVLITLFLVGAVALGGLVFDAILSIDPVEDAFNGH